ncbi:hypothetical protein ACGRHY_28610 [Streptomyces sp. HK10]|uniref:hypothetical protein n=1 Tax=Streptomyces sp. HK10 TaxID=3373255 RepID=UPI00374A23C1
MFKHVPGWEPADRDQLRLVRCTGGVSHARSRHLADGSAQAAWTAADSLATGAQETAQAHRFLLLPACRSTVSYRSCLKKPCAL